MLKEKIDGLGFEIDEDQKVEQLGFSGNRVIATLGMKDGPVCGPVLEFEITGPDSLVIDKGQFNIEWKDIEFYSSHIQVLRNGVATTYKIVQ